MRLLDRPFTRQEKNGIVDALEGCICRICVSDDPLELQRMVGFACDYIHMLAYSNALSLRSSEDPEDPNA